MAKKILIVDDTPAMVSLISDVLLQAGFEVVTAEDGKEGLAAVAKHGPDLLILDISMPVMSGLQVLRRLREESATGLLPVILLTGRDGHSDVLEGWMGGADRYLTKPCSMEELLEAVQQMLEEPTRA
jgi:two-component system alkaline phosphatase synthesis response regulator PhoP